ncbi:MAG: CIA30 family protein [Balneola sp.]|jgi:hypothetical protein|nr:CIA30 family protein [Balneola sp.]MBE78695.1 CIA30 family protein [Balneola sp.]|tara:strand:- start:1492 stop:2022 length:531 start_codon:yes stop_codon:yes gene_type:complete
MKYIAGFLFLMMAFNPKVIFDFNTDSNPNRWSIVDDVVMGGRSDGNMKISPEGHGLFEGEVSLENNGGFSSVRLPLRALDVKPEQKIIIRLKGNGEKYQFRVKHNRRAYQSYVTYFETNGKWQEVEISLNELYPIYRGNRLNRDNFNFQTIEEIGFLIGNKKPQSFRLLIDKIELE